jgi:hypothetical protein
MDDGANVKIYVEFENADVVDDSNIVLVSG